MGNEFCIVIPARLKSTRLEQKLLRQVKGKPLIQWTWENSIKSNAKKVIVVTDSKEIVDIISSLGGNVFLSKREHSSGTDRINEFVISEGFNDEDIIINLQGDEPIIDIEIVNRFAEFMIEKNSNYASICKPFSSRENQDDNNKVKVTLNENNEAISFSRTIIDNETSKNLHHIGVYGFNKLTLNRFSSLPQTKNEIKEKLEQLRAIDNGIKIDMFKIDTFDTFGIDTEEDLLKFKEFISS